MFKLTATFFALLTTTALAMSVVNRAESISPIASSSGIEPAPDDITIFRTCNDPNLTGLCNTWFSPILPSGCGDLAGANQQDSVSSASTFAGIQCTLFQDSGCSGRTQLVVGTINNLATVGFDNTASSFNCQSV
ncbi:hypothetical protein BDZ89DRAFT_1121482 [Hymenopellis radicata]|nr:hypothetical protein BDZ89DRAFT_1121482 [Hymenopellis radicata]